MKDNKSALVIQRTNEIAGSITPPAKKSEIIEAMIRRRMQKIDDEINAAKELSKNAREAFQAAAKQAFDAYLKGKRATAVSENYSASCWINSQWNGDGVAKTEVAKVSVGSHINLPKLESDKLASLAIASRDADSALRKLERNSPTRSIVSGEIRRAMSGEKAPNVRVNAILSDPESVKVIDAALATIHAQGDAKAPVVEL